MSGEQMAFGFASGLTHRHVFELWQRPHLVGEVMAVTEPADPDRRFCHDRVTTWCYGCRKWVDTSAT